MLNDLMKLLGHGRPAQTPAPLQLPQAQNAQRVSTGGGSAAAPVSRSQFQIDRYRDGDPLTFSPKGAPRIFSMGQSQEFLPDQAFHPLEMQYMGQTPDPMPQPIVQNMPFIPIAPQRKVLRKNTLMQFKET